MKKAFHLILSFVLLPFLGNSQLSLRPQVGINTPSITQEILEGKWKGNVGYQFGLDLQVGSIIYVQPGLNFQSSTLTIEDVGDLSISRINIPVMVGFKLFEGEDSKAFGARIFAGPNFGINVSEKLNESIMSITKDNITNSQISGIAGAGFDLSILFIDVAYKFGLTKFFENINNDAKNNYFIVNAGVRIGF